MAIDGAGPLQLWSAAVAEQRGGWANSFGGPRGGEAPKKPLLREVKEEERGCRLSHLDAVPYWLMEEMPLSLLPPPQVCLCLELPRRPRLGVSHVN